jgi:glucose/arabinose dehydrogenase
MRYSELDVFPDTPRTKSTTDTLTAELVAQGFDFPTSIAFADDGTPYVAESGLTFGGARGGGRIVRIETDGGRTLVLDNLRQPVNGLTWHAGGFYIAEGGFPGRITRWVPGDAPQTILDGLPGHGNYHTNTIAVGPDGWLYFGQGAMTNSGVVGLDAYDLAWLKALPHPFDVPGYDIELAGQTFETDDPLAHDPEKWIPVFGKDHAQTKGVFQIFSK